MKIRWRGTKYKFVKKVIAIETMKNNKLKSSTLRDIFMFWVDLTNANLHLYIMIVLPDTHFFYRVNQMFHIFLFLLALWSFHFAMFLHNQTQQSFIVLRTFSKCIRVVLTRIYIFFPTLHKVYISCPLKEKYSAM